jgi:hypothetical protein
VLAVFAGAASSARTRWTYACVVGHENIEDLQRVLAVETERAQADPPPRPRSLPSTKPECTPHPRISSRLGLTASIKCAKLQSTPLLPNSPLKRERITPSRRMRVMAALTADRVLIEIEVNIDCAIANQAKFATDFDRWMKAVESSASRAEQRISSSFTKIGSSLRAGLAGPLSTVTIEALARTLRSVVHNPARTSAMPPTRSASRQRSCRGFATPRSSQGRL